MVRIPAVASLDTSNKPFSSYRSVKHSIHAVRLIEILTRQP